MMDREQELTTLFRQLAAADQAMLLEFATFLASRDTAQPVVAAAPSPVAIPEPEPIERPPGETVVAGLKRLSKTYPMLDKSAMLSATSDMVAGHIMQGTDPALVIDELENIFRAHYLQLKAGGGQ